MGLSIRFYFRELFYFSYLNKNILIVNDIKRIYSMILSNKMIRLSQNF